MDLMIKHIGTSAIMDFLLRMLTCTEPQQLRQGVLNVSVLSPVLSEMIHLKGEIACIGFKGSLGKYAMKVPTSLWLLVTCKRHHRHCHFNAVACFTVLH